MGSAKSNGIIPVFLSYMGCPNQCLFCSQKGVTEDDSQRSFEELDERVMTFISSRSNRSNSSEVSSRRFEIAFYGGTFTSIPEPMQEAFLRWAYRWLERGSIDSIRVSTRPDDLTVDKLQCLARYGVKTIEIGAQSFDDHTLRLNRRSYTSEDIDRAFGLLKSSPFRVGVHLMTHLYGSSEAIDAQSLSAALSYRPAFLRLHPTLVLRHTGLERLYRERRYRPASLFEGVDGCSDALLLCRSAQTPVARMGLHIPANRVSEVVAGPYHPAFGDLVSKMADLKELIASERLVDYAGDGLDQKYREALGSHKGFFAKWFRERSREARHVRARR